MNNRLLLGAAVEISNAVGLKQNRILVFLIWICQHIKAQTQCSRTMLQFQFIADSASERKNQLIEIVVLGINHLQVCTLLLPSVTNLEHFCSFVYMNILMFLSVFDFCWKAPVIKNHLSCIGIKSPESYSAESLCSTTSFSPLLSLSELLCILIQGLNYYNW